MKELKEFKELKELEKMKNEKDSDAISQFIIPKMQEELKNSSSKEENSQTSFMFEANKMDRKSSLVHTQEKRSSFHLKNEFSEVLIEGLTRKADKIYVLNKFKAMKIKINENKTKISEINEEVNLIKVI